MVKEGGKIPVELIRELDINEKEEITKNFEVLPRIEPHQIKLPLPKELVRDLDLGKKWKNKKKIKLVFDEKTKELRFKI